MFGPEVLFIWLFRAVTFYGGIIALAVGTISLISRKTAAGVTLIIAGAIPIGLWSAYWMMTVAAPLKRTAEVASWRRTVPSAAEQPRTLVIHENRHELRPYIFYLAETGLFDVFVEQGTRHNPAGRSTWRIDVAERDGCKERRKEYDEFVARTGWRACGAAVPAETVPADALVLYTSHITAPHSWWSTRRGDEPETAWTLELGWRSGGDEKLVAYDEFLMFREMNFHPMIGPVTRPRDPPRRLGWIAAPEPARFTLGALGIDERTATPRFALSTDERRRLLDTLIATGEAGDMQRALDLIASGDRDEISRFAITRLARSPDASAKMHLTSRGDPELVCEKIEKLAQFRDDLIKGCNTSAVATDVCGQIAHPRHWLGNCADNSLPLWRSTDPPARRMFVADLRGGDPTRVTLSKPARLIEFRVPPDRGAIDLVIRNGSPRIFAFTGAVSCIARLTVLEHGDPSTGIYGIDRRRVRFASPTGTGNWINPQAPFYTMKDVLGIEPDVLLLDHEGALDIGEKLSASRSAPPCAPDGTGRSEHAPKPTDVVRVNVEDILTAPPLLPLLRTQ